MNLRYIRKLVTLMLVVIAAFLLLMLLGSKPKEVKVEVSNTPPETVRTTKSTKPTTTSTTTTATTTKVYVPKKPPKLMTYKIFDTSKYVNKEGQLYVPLDDVLNSMTLAELEELYNRYQETIQVVCPRLQHIGEDFDGGYHICETMVPKNSCLAYSFGNNNDYTFDGGLAEIYGCEVHSFDPGDGQEDHKQSDKITFHKLGISGKDEVTKDNMVLKTVDSVRKMLHHGQRSIDILKIDTENAEWAAFPQILESKTLQRANVKLLIVEFHSVFMTRDKEFYLSSLRTLRGLDSIGYKRYFFRNWIYCPIKDPVTNINRVGCHEGHFMKV